MIASRRNILRQEVERSFEGDQVLFLERLVNQPSHTAAVDDVEQLQRTIDERAAAVGLSREVVANPGGGYAAHRIHSTPGVGGGDKAVALIGHCDTVYPRSQGFLTFRRDAPDSPSEGDRGYGPGVLDMKSGLTVILFALQALQRAAPDVFANLRARFVCNTDEEVGSPSSEALFRRLAPLTDMALVFEGGRDEDRIITSRKGTGGFKLTVTGRDAHAGNDHAAGVNAIHAMALLIPRVEAMTDYEQGTTVNVGLVRGGTARNSVPGEAQIEIDVRVTGLAAAKALETAMADLAERPFEGLGGVPERLRQVQVRVEGGLQRAPMEATPESQHLRRRYERYASAAGLGVGEAPLQGGGSDASVLAPLGVPVIDGLGPYGKFFHSPKEWCSLSSLRKRTLALALFLADLVDP